MMATESLNEAYQIWRDHLRQGANNIQEELSNMEAFIQELSKYNDDSLISQGGIDFITTNTTLLRELLGDKQFNELLNWD